MWMVVISEVDVIFRVVMSSKRAENGLAYVCLFVFVVGVNC